RPRGSARTARGGVERHPRLGRAADGGRYRERTADDQRRRDDAADARRRRHRRRQPRRRHRQRPACRARVLRRAQGGRVSALTDLTMAEARDGLRARQFSACELAAAYNAAVEQFAPLNAFVTTTPEQALEMAAASDARLAKGEGRALEGIPLA